MSLGSEEINKSPMQMTSMSLQVACCVYHAVKKEEEGEEEEEEAD